MTKTTTCATQIFTIYNSFIGQTVKAKLGDLHCLGRMGKVLFRTDRQTDKTYTREAIQENR